MEEITLWRAETPLCSSPPPLSLGSRKGRARGLFLGGRQQPPGACMAAGCCGERAFGVTWGGRGGGGAVCWCLFGSKGGLQHRVFVGELRPGGALPFRSCAFSAPAFQPAPYARGLAGRGRGERRGTKGVRWRGGERDRPCTLGASCWGTSSTGGTTTGALRKRREGVLVRDCGELVRRGGQVQPGRPLPGRGAPGAAPGPGTCRCGRWVPAEWSG